MTADLVGDPPDTVMFVMNAVAAASDPLPLIVIVGVSLYFVPLLVI